MPNHVTHKIIFPAERHLDVFAAVLDPKDGGFDFNLLVPQPPQLYHGDISGTDEADFKCNWHSWNREHWGTKWGAYKTTSGLDGDRAFIQFDTAWSVPYPILSAFNNRFQMPFEHRYYDEGENFWGIERWAAAEYGQQPRPIVRREKLFKRDEDRVALCIELKGYDPDREDEAA